MKKFVHNLKNKAGYVSIEAIVVVVLMLGLAGYAFTAFHETGRNLIDQAEDGVYTIGQELFRDGLINEDPF